MIEFKNVSKIYPGNQVALDNINLKIEDGEFVCFIGTSGSGKTTAMRMINKMTDISSGEILIDGKNLDSYNPVELRRSIGYVIQQIGLMPHYNIYENIVMVPKLLGWDEKALMPLAEELLKKVDLPKEYLTKYPSELSGGQQQRVGVIRALAADQKIILMDEPFGALDPITRDALQKLVKKLQKELGKTIVFVSHDMTEALTLADKIVIMSKGKIVQADSPENILKNPANDYVKELLGEEKLNEAKTSYNTVETIMIKNPVSILESETAYDAIILMRDKRVDTLLVVNKENILLGIVSIFDIGRAGKKNPQVKDIMYQAKSINNNTKIIEAIHAFYNLTAKNLPVTDDLGHLVGLVTRASIVDTIYENLWSENNDDELILDDASKLIELTEEAKGDEHANLFN